jgi:hypothetical protein
MAHHPYPHALPWGMGGQPQPQPQRPAPPPQRVAEPDFKSLRHFGLNIGDRIEVGSGRFPRGARAARGGGARPVEAPSWANQLKTFERLEPAPPRAAGQVDHRQRRRHQHSQGGRLLALCAGARPRAAPPGRAIAPPARCTAR